MINGKEKAWATRLTRWLPRSYIERGRYSSESGLNSIAIVRSVRGYRRLRKSARHTQSVIVHSRSVSDTELERTPIYPFIDGLLRGL